MIRLLAPVPSPPLSPVSWTGDNQEDLERETICLQREGGVIVQFNSIQQTFYFVLTTGYIHV
jgi:hypothetical protein